MICENEPLSEKIINFYKKSLISNNRNVDNMNFDKKSYLYRYIDKFSKKISSFNLSDDDLRELVQAIVSSAKELDMLHFGGTIFNNESIVDRAFSRINNYNEINKQFEIELTKSKEFLENNNIETHIDLIKKINKHGYPKIIYYINNNNLNLTYVAISSMCLKSLNVISIDERNEAPSNFELLKIRNKIFNNKEKLLISKNVLGKDLITLKVWR